MRCIIIGASGFVGSHFMSYFKSKGHEVIGTRASTTRNDLYKFDLATDRIEDCIPSSFLSSKNQQPVAVICSCISQIDRCFKERELTKKINVDKTITLLKDLIMLNIKPVFISTSAVFDGVHGYYNEQDLRCPVSEYGRQKALVESFIEQQCPRVLVFRLDKMVSDDPRKNHMFTDWYRCLKEGKPIVSIEGQHFSPTYVNDVALAIVLASRISLTGIYHVANPEFFTRDELARQFVRVLGMNSEFIVRRESEFGFSDRRTLKAYMDGSKFIDITNIRFTPMSKLFLSFKEKLGGIKKEEMVSPQAN